MWENLQNKKRIRKHRLVIQAVGQPKYSCNTYKKTFLEKHQLKSHLIRLHESEKLKYFEPERHRTFAAKSVHEKKSFTSIVFQNLFIKKYSLKNNTLLTIYILYNCKIYDFKW